MWLTFTLIRFSLTRSQLDFDQNLCYKITLHVVPWLIHCQTNEGKPNDKSPNRRKLKETDEKDDQK